MNLSQDEILKTSPMTPSSYTWRFNKAYKNFMYDTDKAAIDVYQYNGKHQVEFSPTDISKKMQVLEFDSIVEAFEKAEQLQRDINSILEWNILPPGSWLQTTESTTLDTISLNE